MKVMKPKRWSDRKYYDVCSGWQFRTFPSKRYLQICLSIDDWQGDGVFLISVHLFKKALAFEFPFDGNKPYPKKEWRLYK
jgi:hypothetical protein